MILSGATTLGLSGPGSYSNKEVLCIFQSSSISRASPSDCLMLYLEHSLGRSYSSAEKQLVYSTAPADWAIIAGVLLLCRDVVDVFFHPGWLGLTKDCIETKSKMPSNLVILTDAIIRLSNFYVVVSHYILLCGVWWKGRSSFGTFCDGQWSLYCMVIYVAMLYYSFYLSIYLFCCA